MRRFRFTITDRNNRRHTVTVTAASVEEARGLARQEFLDLGFTNERDLSSARGRIGSLSSVQDLGPAPAVAEPEAIPGTNTQRDREI